MCSNSASGCGWVGELRSLNDHLTVCGYAVLHCTNKCMENRKEVRILRRDLDHHLKNECPNRQYQCSHCEATGRYCNITTTHLATCPKVKIPCPNSDCKALVPRCKLSDHLTACEYTLLHCPNKCIENTNEVQMLRRDLDHHLKDACPNRQYQCPHCKDTGRYCDITTTHLDICSKLKIPCPNSECKSLVFRCDFADHQSKCLFQKVPCTYAGIGCEEELLRKDLEQHEKEDAILHLQLATETVHKQQQEINELKDEIDELEEEIDELEEEIDEQREEIKKQHGEMKTVKDEQIILSDGITAGQAGPCVFKMTKYHQHKSTKDIWYSPPFYTHPGGYKMCIKVYANGCDDGADTHVSVFAYLMRGKNDDNLPWPFTGRVGITLLNQLTDKNHYTNTVSFPQDSDEANKRILDGERAHTGYGQPTFISHNQLGYDTAKNCQYLRDDCLYFQIKVQAAKPMKPWLTCTV